MTLVLGLDLAGLVEEDPAMLHKTLQEVDGGLPTCRGRWTGAARRIRPAIGDDRNVGVDDVA
jgi:hypothetical protein